jgi:hypothetical protein
LIRLKMSSFTRADFSHQIHLRAQRLSEFNQKFSLLPGTQPQ